jgi:SpoVK/Ycf46/Vps4 family AAA+-type ATPase
VMCFDLNRHARVKLYVDQLTRYEYRTDLGDKLILPADVRGLVDLLVGHKGGFEDIIAGKSGGAIILCAGSPGTGKTLTAQVYSEAMSRPLYSVQCSQLGVDPESLEKELLIVFARAARWNAILLLDEADVYVAARGRDLTQNAIVGVFLRILEYYSGVLFLTTNRADLVDDAVASRCLARIDYAVPSPADQAKIWRTLADTSGVRMADAEIAKIVERFPYLSGRDVKNLLKLGSMVAGVRGGPVTADVIAGVKPFKPTADPAPKK